ncbi:MAG: phosphoribosylaminoimidazolesuccinocarboxamide synthase [Candidatus Paceibacterota bacterium]
MSSLTEAIEGKTKIITPFKNVSNIGVVTAKDDITAGDGAKHDIMSGKAKLATRTTCNVFDFLHKGKIPLAYIGRDTPTTFLTWVCSMIPIEVVVRFVATGSYLKRNPDITDGTVFDEPVVEFFYKTNGQKFGNQGIGCDDPLMVINDKGDNFNLYYPHKPIDHNGYVANSSSVYSSSETGSLTSKLIICRKLALSATSCLDVAWQFLGGELYDLKFEFGIRPDGDQIVLADVVDCDSWRVMWNGIQLSKQPYRDGVEVEEILDIYRLAASLTDRFTIL